MEAESLMMLQDLLHFWGIC